MSNQPIWGKAGEWTMYEQVMGVGDSHESIPIDEAQADVIMTALLEAACSDEQACDRIIRSLCKIYPEIVLRYKSYNRVQAVIDQLNDIS